MTVIKTHLETSQPRTWGHRTQPDSEGEEITVNITNKRTGIHSIAWVRAIATIIIKRTFHKTGKAVIINSLT